MHYVHTEINSAFNWLSLNNKVEEHGYRISANSFRGNYSFLEVEVRQLFKGGKYSTAETINFLNSFCKPSLFE